MPAPSIPHAALKNTRVMEKESPVSAIQCGFLLCSVSGIWEMYHYHIFPYKLGWEAATQSQEQGDV